MLVMTIVLIVSACGGDADSDTTGAEGATTTDPFSFDGTSAGSTDDGEGAATTTAASSSELDCLFDHPDVCSLPVAILTEIPMDFAPQSLAIDGTTAWVLGEDFDGNGVLVPVDLVAGTVGDQLPVEGLAVKTSDGELWVVTDDAVLQIDPAGGANLAEYPDPPGSSMVLDAAISPDALWASVNGTGEVVRWDRDTGEITATVTDYDNLVAGGQAPIGLGFGSVWVIDSHGGRLLQIDPGAGEISATFDDLGYESRDEGDGLTSILAAGPVAFAVTDDVMWVASDVVNQEGENIVGTGAVFELDPSDGVLRRIDTVLQPNADAGVASGNDAVWFAASGGDRLVRVDAATGREWYTDLGLRSVVDLAVADGSVWALVEGLGSATALISIDEAAAATLSAELLGGG
jgi:streptogramin lyase